MIRCGENAVWREFRRYDPNGDGVVTKLEWMRWVHDQFVSRDINLDGGLTSENLGR